MLPLTRYIGVTAPVPPKVEWLQFFPFSEVVAMSREGTDAVEESDANGPNAVTFYSGDANLPGSAMNKCKQSIGFLSVEVEVFLIEPAYKLYLKSSHPSSKWAPDQEVC